MASQENALPMFRYPMLLLMAVTTGVLLSLAIPVSGCTPLIFVALVPLLLAEDYIHHHRENFRKGSFFLIAFIAMLIFNASGSWWLKNASAAGAIMAVMVNTLLMTLVWQLFHGGRRQFRASNTGYLALVSYWIAFEFFHHNWDLTYPWHSFGNFFSSKPAWVQWYEYTGILGGSVWVLVANIMVFSLIRLLLSNQHNRKFLLIRISHLMAWIIIPFVISVVIYHSRKPQGDGFEVVVVQPNHDPYSEQYSIGPAAAIGNFLKLATPLISEKTRFVIGPESMIQENIWERHFDHSPSLQSLQRYAAQNPHLTIIAGASSFRMRYTHEPVTIASRNMDTSFMMAYASWFDVPLDSLTPYYEAFNLGFAIDTSGVTGVTHKSKLVAGVERMPFKKYLANVAGDLALDLGGTVGTLASDPERTVFKNKPSATRYGVAICYESAFGEFFGEFVRKGAQYMIIITNDGWWGNTPGHRQHNAFASLRAIETRRFIARSANTGISTLVNSRGDLIQPTNYWEPAAIKGQLIPSDKITFYVRYGDYLGRMAMVITILLFLIRISYTIVPLRLRKSR